jgi:poly(beta-D-mannuronate) lyase
VEKLSGAKQVKLPREKDGKIRGDRIAWLEVYLHHFPEERKVYGNLFNKPLFSSNLGGRTTVIYNIDKRN